MPVLTEPPSMGDILKYEVNPNYTREVVTLLAGMPYPVGAVLGRITASGKYKLATSGGTDGAQTASAVLLYAVDATLADATGIVVVTTIADGFDHAMTATSFTTVSLDPMLVLVCIEQDTRFRDALISDSGTPSGEGGRQWAISVLPSSASARIGAWAWRRRISSGSTSMRTR